MEILQRAEAIEKNSKYDGLELLRKEMNLINVYNFEGKKNILDIMDIEFLKSKSILKKNGFIVESIADFYISLKIMSEQNKSA